jgi:hypothetical protein
MKNAPELFHEPGAIQVAPVGSDPASLMALAIQHGGADAAEVIERLTRLQVEMQDRADRRELFAAIARFQKECPPIKKTSTAEIAGQSGKFSYSYADLETIADTISMALHLNSLSYSWDTEANDAGTRMKVTCVLRHINGQSVTSTFDCPTDSRAGMSPQQKFSAAQMYGRRMSLCQVLGLVAVDVPDAVANQNDAAKVTAEQAANLSAMADEVLDADARKRFMAYLGVEAFADVPESRLAEALAALGRKRKGAAK